MKKILAFLFSFVLIVQLADAQTTTKTLSTTTCPGAGCITVDVSGAGSVGFQVTGTFSGTLTFTQSIDKSTFVSWSVLPNGLTTAVTTATAAGYWVGNTFGANQIRVAFTSFTSGTAVVTFGKSQARSLFGVPSLSGGILPFSQGGLGFATATTGDLFYASATDTPGKLSLGTVGKILRSNGTIPAYTTATYPDTVATGDLLTATGTNVLGVTADVATGKVLTSGGVGVVPAYSASPTLAAGTITTSQPVAITQTWNTIGTAYQGLSITVTDSTAAADSRLINILGGASGTTELFYVRRDGTVFVPNSSVKATGGGFSAASAGSLSFGTRSVLTSPADGQFNITNTGVTAGVGFDFATDAVLKIRTRAQTGNAALTASTLTASAGSGSGTFKASGSICYNGTFTDSAVQNQWNVFTCTIPASTLATNGDVLEVEVPAHYATNGNTKGVQLYFNGGTCSGTSAACCSTGTQAFSVGGTSSNVGQITNVKVVRTGSGAQTISALVSTDTSIQATNTVAATVTDTNDIPITWCARNADAAAATVQAPLPLMTVKYVPQ